MLEIFKRPYKETFFVRDKLITVLVFGLFIFLFLYLFKPFGLTQLKPAEQFFITLGFGLVTAFVLFVFKFLLEPVVTRKNWTFGKSLIWVTVIASSIGIANYFYMTILFHQIVVFKYFLYSIWTAILVGCIPVTISYIVSFNRMYKNALKEASISAEEILWENEVIIRAGNPKNEVRINPKNIVYLCSNDNYVTIVTLKDDLLNKTTIRGTIKAAELELHNNARFLRCHKCYLVNLDFVERITGNMQNMKIRLSGSETEIPVSRSKAGEVSKKVKRNKF
jgi:hypothetical protein